MEQSVLQLMKIDPHQKESLVFMSGMIHGLIGNIWVVLILIRIKMVYGVQHKSMMKVILSKIQNTMAFVMIIA